MLIGPPGALKTTMIEDSYNIYPNALIVADLNINTLMALRQDLVSGRFSTIAFTEFEKLYQRRADTAAFFRHHQGDSRQLKKESFTDKRWPSQPQHHIGSLGRRMLKENVNPFHRPIRDRDHENQKHCRKGKPLHDQPPQKPATTGHE